MAATSSTTRARPSPTQIIRDGILQGGLTDPYSASRLGISRTANGRRERAPQGLCADVEHLLHARLQHPRRAAGEPGRRRVAATDAERDGGPQGLGHPDLGPVRGRVQARQAHRPDLLAGGDHRLRADVLADVSMVSDDFQLDGGTCGKGWKELVPVTRAVPTAPAAGWPEHGPAPDRCSGAPSGGARLDRAPAGRARRADLPGRQPGRERARSERESYEVELFNDHQADGEPSRGAAKVPVSRADLERLPEVLETAPPWPAWSTTRRGPCRSRTTCRRWSWPTPR